MQVRATIVVKEQMNKGALSHGPEHRSLEGGKERVLCNPRSRPSVFLHSHPHLHLASADLLGSWALTVVLAPGEEPTRPYSESGGPDGGEASGGGGPGDGPCGCRRMKVCSEGSSKAWPGNRGMASCREREPHGGDLSLEFVPVIWESRTVYPVGPVVLLGNFLAVLNSALLTQLLGWNSRNLPSLLSEGHLVLEVAVL